MAHRFFKIASGDVPSRMADESYAKLRKYAHEIWALEEDPEDGIVAKRSDADDNEESGGSDEGSTRPKSKKDDVEDREHIELPILPFQPGDAIVVIMGGREYPASVKAVHGKSITASICGYEVENIPYFMVRWAAMKIFDASKLPPDKLAKLKEQVQRAYEIYKSGVMGQLPPDVREKITWLLEMGQQPALRSGELVDVSNRKPGDTGSGKTGRRRRVADNGDGTSDTYIRPMQPDGLSDTYIRPAQPDSTGIVEAPKSLSSVQDINIPPAPGAMPKITPQPPQKVVPLGVDKSYSDMRQQVVKPRPTQHGNKQQNTIRHPVTITSPNMPSNLMWLGTPTEEQWKAMNSPEYDADYRPNVAPQIRPVTELEVKDWGAEVDAFTKNK
jgi:hypothetical protein